MRIKNFFEGAYKYPDTNNNTIIKSMKPLSGEMDEVRLISIIFPGEGDMIISLIE